MCIYTIITYNKLIKLRARVENSWAQVEVQLKKRYDLIPNLVETVKGYAKHEEGVLTKVTQARASVGGAKSSDDLMASNNELSGALSRLLIVAERYPELKANTNFLDVQTQLKDIENKIAISRQFYNDTVMNYNQKLELFPSNIIAKIFKFQSAHYFEVDEASKEPPKVDFTT